MSVLGNNLIMIILKYFQIYQISSLIKSWVDMLLNKPNQIKSNDFPSIYSVDLKLTGYKDIALPVSEKMIQPIKHVLLKDMWSGAMVKLVF